MTQETLDLLRCPCGDSKLRLTDDVRQDGRVVSGILRCSACGSAFPIEGGIARLVPRTGAEPTDDEARKASEMKARDAQVSDYDRMSFLKLLGRFETPMALRRLRIPPGGRLLEAGSGTGRMTSRFAREASRVVAVDFSIESLKVNREKLSRAGIGNVDLAQADICALPFADGSFDRVVSCQVLEHVPSEAARVKAVAELARVCADGGRVVITAYQHSIFTRLFAQKTGEHEGGIYYYRFSKQELGDLLSTALDLKSITRSLIYVHMALAEKTK